jgi:uncharacterized iron-regulated protein
MEIINSTSMKIIGTICLVFALNIGFAQELDAYRIYDQDGKQIDFGTMSKSLSKQDVVLFGELHNDPIGHWLQLKLAQSLDNQNELVLGAEWFERDDQLIIDEYLEGTISIDHLKKETKVWLNYETDYKPILEFAQENEIDFIATNIPRRYASLVSKKGSAALDSLSGESKRLMPALPFSVTEGDVGYEDMKAMMGHGHGHFNIENMIAAQALKDYTMASSIFNNREKGQLFLHFNGSFHSQKFSGIHAYLKAAEPKLKIGVISSVSSDYLEWNEEWEGLGTYILVVPEEMTKTH